MTRKVDKFLKDGRGRIPVLILAVVAAVVTVTLVAAQPWAGGPTNGPTVNTEATATPGVVPWWCEYWETQFPDECATPVPVSTPTNTPQATYTPEPAETAIPTPAATPTKNPATIKVIIGGGTGGDSLSSGSVEEWVAMFGTAVHASRDDAAQVMPFAGIVSQLAVRLSEAPGTGGSYTFTLYVDGSCTDVGGTSEYCPGGGGGGGAGNGPQPCIIGGAGTSCQDKQDSVCVDKDQLIAIQSTGKEVVTESASMVWTAEVTPINGTCPGE